MKWNNYVDVLPEVRQAIENKVPVVALESTIISHGMPYPQNLETARVCEERIRKEGAIPAVTAVIDGRIKVGVTKEELEVLAEAKDVQKLTRRDLATMIACKGSGATTVAAAMMFADLAGIRVFATGGIGGVHRGVAESWDISADLEELATTDVCVVCAGIKSILDIPKTLDYLETKGVPVFAMGQKRFPAFFTSDSGCDADYAAKDAEEVARILAVKKELGLRGGVLVGNPIPKAYEMDKAVIDTAIASALAECEKQDIRGKDTTPFLLGKIVELTGGSSLKSNMELVYENCTLAAKIAVALSKQ